MSRWPIVDKACPNLLSAAQLYRYEEDGHGEAPFLEGESSDILKEIRETIPNANEWLDTPNTRLWCKKPRELIGTPQERQLRYLLRGIWNGVTS